MHVTSVSDATRLKRCNSLVQIFSESLSSQYCKYIIPRPPVCSLLLLENSNLHNMTMKFSLVVLTVSEGNLFFPFNFSWLFHLASWWSQLTGSKMFSVWLLDCFADQLQTFALGVRERSYWSMPLPDQSGGWSGPSRHCKCKPSRYDLITKQVC